MELRTRLASSLGSFAQAGAAGSAAQTAAPRREPAQIAKGDTISTRPDCATRVTAATPRVPWDQSHDAEWIHGDGSVAMIAATVTAGVPKEKAKSGIPMPPKGGSSISDEDVNAVAAYVHSLTKK
jgi:hypothetical protein